MLNLNCVICSELFSHSDDVHATPCGHMFHLNCLTRWMERSKSCPQCRNRCTERSLFRIYFNLANLDVSSVDVGSLQEQLDNLKLQITIKDKEITASAEQIKHLKDMQKKSMKTVKGLEQNLQRCDFLAMSYTEQIKQLKSDVRLMDDLRKENKQLKQQIETMEGVSSMINGTAADVDKLLKSESDPKKLCILVTVLRRELRTCENKKTDLRNVLKVVQSDFRKEIELKKAREDQIVQLESLNYELNEKVKKLEHEIAFINNNNNSHNNNKDLKPTSLLVKPIVAEERRLSNSPTIKENVKKIEESNSPYLNIKSSSVGLLPLFKRHHEPLNSTEMTSRAVVATTTTKLATIKISPIKNNNNAVSMVNGGASGSNIGSSNLRKTSSDFTERYSIFKKPRLGMIASTASAGAAGFTKPIIGSNFVSNGFGGSERADPFAPSSDVEGNDDDGVGDGADVESRPHKKASSQNINRRLKAGGLRDFKIQK